MSASTHSGHCQACGRLQRLPFSARSQQAVLAKHGYNVIGGYFSGTCAGSGHQAFEESCELVKSFIESASHRADQVEALQARLRTASEEPKAWVHHYVGSARGRSSYVWQLVTIAVEDKGGWFEYYYMAPSRKSPEPVRHRLESYALPSGAFRQPLIAAVCLQLNSKYADWLQHEVDSLNRYIQWQTERVETWQPAPLLPHDAKDKAGFVPTSPAY